MFTKLFHKNFFSAATKFVYQFFTCSTSHLLKFPLAQIPTCSTSHLLNFPPCSTSNLLNFPPCSTSHLAQLPSCSTSHLLNFPPCSTSTCSTSQCLFDLWCDKDYLESCSPVLTLFGEEKWIVRPEWMLPCHKIVWAGLHWGLDDCLAWPGLAPSLTALDDAFPPPSKICPGYPGKIITQSTASI